MLDLNELKRLFDKSFNYNQSTREDAADSLVFAAVTQWDDNLLSTAQLQYRGQFDILRKAIRQIIADLRSNPVQVNFEPKAETKQDGADFLDGLYRSGDRINTSIESFDNASMESVICGVGAWVLETEYESNRAGNQNQVIRRKPIYEANNNCFWDPNAKLLDKSDADYVSILYAYSEDGYKKLAKDLTGKECDSDASFKFPEESYVFPWIAEDKKIYVTEFYHREKVKSKILIFSDPFGGTITLDESKIESVQDELIDSGYQITDEKTIDKWEVTKYIASGAEILSHDVIAGENIPVIPTYGERIFVEGEEHYEGITRLAKDPQRLRNFQMSYLADIVSRSPRPKPIFYPEQVQGFEDMYAESGADNNYPYMLANRQTANGEDLPPGPAGMMPEQQIPTALIASMELSRQAVEDVANPGLPQNLADPDLSGKAVIALQNRMDKQSMVYQQNLKHAKRRDGEIYASMAAEIYDAPRTVVIVKPDGTKAEAKVLEKVIDKETGEAATLNDLTNSEFSVFSDIGPSYSSMKDQTVEQLTAMIPVMDDPAMRKMLTLKVLQLIPGTDFEDVRDYSRKQLLLSGVVEPETPEEEQIVMQAQQSQQPDAMMIAAQAEQGKAQAAQMKAQTDNMKAQADAQNNQMKSQIDAFDAQTKRLDVQVDAQRYKAELDFKKADAMVGRMNEVRNNFMGRLSQ